MVDVPAAVRRRCEQLSGEALAISRATWLADVRWELPATAIPVVAGTTVWTAAPTSHIPVVECPNWFGRVEKAVPHGHDAIVVVWWQPAVAAPPRDAIDAHRDMGTLDSARNLAGRLRQLRGVRLPHGQPESPWFIAGLPGDAAKVAAELAAAGFSGNQPLGGRFPEFPGGLRIEVAWSPAQNHRFVELVRTALGG